MPSCLQRFWVTFGVNNSESSGETSHPASHIPGDEIRPRLYTETSLLEASLCVINDSNYFSQL